MKRKRSDRIGTGNLGCILLLGLILTTILPAISSATDPVFVPTFECIGIYWKPTGAGIYTSAHVEYRENLGCGNWGDWQQGHDLWYDARTFGAQYPTGAGRSEEYRGSVVNLKAGTAYEVRLYLGDPPAQEVTTAVTTWSETFEVESTETLGTHYVNTTYPVDEGGTTPDTYVLYEANPAGTLIEWTTTPGSNNHCIRVSASNVIIRGLTLVGGYHGIFIEEGVENVIIEDCDISGWGIEDPAFPGSGWGKDLNSAIFAGDHNARPADIERLIIQRNVIHDPAWNSNSWLEYRSGGYDCGYQQHPEGPQGVTLLNVKGRNVIRFNEFYSDEDHYFNDIIGGGSNFSHFGCPGADSDIYQNNLSYCWDDAIEAEGSNANVRIWENYIDRTYVKIACNPTTVGPLYIFHNIAARSRWCPLEVADYCDNGGNRGPFLKTGNKDHNGETIIGNWGDGQVYVYQNTLLQPDDNLGEGYQRGCSHALRGPNTRFFKTRNNIFQVPPSKSLWPIWTGCGHASNDFDYDMINGNLWSGHTPPNAEENGWYELDSSNYIPDYSPGIYDPNTGGGNWGQFWIRKYSTGFEECEYVANFSDPITGYRADVGAQDYIAPLLEFGIEAAPPLPPDPVTIVLQDGLNGYTGHGDATISQSSPSNKTGTYVYAPLMARYQDPSPTHQVLQKFDVSAIPTGSTIVSAEFQATNLYGFGGSTSTINLYRMLETWEEDCVCWNESDCGVSWNPLTATDLTETYGVFEETAPPQTNDPMVFDIACLVQEWVDDPGQGAKGFILIEQDGNFRILHTAEATGADTAYRPMLTVTYQPPPGFRQQPDLDLESDTLADGGNQLTGISGLHGNSANPFNPTTRIYFTVGQEDLAAGGTAQVRLEVFDVAGRRVSTLRNGMLSAGDYSVLWEGKTDDGRDIGSGIYFNKLSIGEKSFRTKMILTK